MNSSNPQIGSALNIPFEKTEFVFETDEFQITYLETTSNNYD